MWIDKATIEVKTDSSVDNFCAIVINNMVMQVTHVSEKFVVLKEITKQKNWKVKEHLFINQEKISTIDDLLYDGDIPLFDVSMSLNRRYSYHTVIELIDMLYYHEDI